MLAGEVEEAVEGALQDNKDIQSQNSFGTGSFTTGTFNTRLVGSHGMQILKYVQSEEFGKHGESIKLIENFQVSFSNQLSCRFC